MEYPMTNIEVNLQKRRRYNGDCFVSGQNVKKIYRNFIDFSIFKSINTIYRGKRVTRSTLF